MLAANYGARLRLSMTKMTRGFTIVELTVVIVVIGILAGIAIVGYSAAQRKAQDTAVQTDLEQIADQFDIFRTRSSTDSYPSNQAELESLDMKITKSAYSTTVAVNVFACVAADLKSFAIVSQSKSGNILKITNTSDTSAFTPVSSFTLANTCPSLSMNYVLSGWQSSAWRPWVES